MTGPQLLSDQQLAEYFVEATGQPRRGADPIDLEPSIQAWLERSNLAHRRAFSIAVEVAKIAAVPAPLPTPGQAAWQQNQAEGISEPTAQIPDPGSMTMSEFAEYRKSIGLDRQASASWDR